MKALHSAHTKQDFLEEASRLTDLAAKQGIAMRVIGATAFRIHCPKTVNLHRALGRELSDLDFVSYSKHQHKIENLFLRNGYVSRPPSISLHLGGRQIYIDQANKRTVDVFLDKLIFCHDVDLRKRLEVDYPTIPLADLVLQKLQIVKLTEKDVTDLSVLFLEHGVGEKDDETINCRYIADLLSKDWGFYHTATRNLAKLESMIPRYELLREHSEEICQKMKSLLSYIDRAPKSMTWKARSRVGESVKWYREVDTIKI